LFLHCLRMVLPDVIAFRPDIVFFQSGVDGLACDRLGRLALTHKVRVSQTAMCDNAGWRLRGSD
jgi:acetoin utilization deacetylase AcuC-like enzyme